MNKNQVEFLTKKLIEITNHIEVQLENRRAMLKGYNEEIKSSKTRVKAYAKAVQIESIEPLHEVMGEFELTEFEKIGR